MGIRNSIFPWESNGTGMNVMNGNKYAATGKWEGMESDRSLGWGTYQETTPTMIYIT